MIQLATEPTDSRTGFRPEPTEGKGSFANQRGRSGHAWPFLSRYASRPAREEAPKSAGTPSGS